MSVSQKPKRPKRDVQKEHLPLDMFNKNTYFYAIYRFNKKELIYWWYAQSKKDAEDLLRLALKDCDAKKYVGYITKIRPYGLTHYQTFMNSIESMLKCDNLPSDKYQSEPIHIGYIAPHPVYILYIPNHVNPIKVRIITERGQYPVALSEDYTNERCKCISDD